MLTGPGIGSIKLPFTVIDQADAPDLLIVAMQSLAIGPNAGVSIAGDRAIVLVALGDLTVEGQISAGAVGPANGPGGDNPESCATGRGADGVLQMAPRQWAAADPGTGRGGSRST